MPAQLVLGSTSPFRRALMERLHIPFITASPNIDETRQPNESADAMVERLALQKAQAVAQKYPQAFIVGSDQCAVLGEQILGKPGNHENAIKQLQASSGQTIQFLTSLCLYNAQTRQSQLSVVPYQVTFRELSAQDIEAYLQTEQPYNCAGSFKSEGLGISLFTQMQGDDPNALIGLPLIRLCEMLRHVGISIPDKQP